MENGTFRCTPSSGDNFNMLNFMSFSILSASLASNVINSNNNNNNNNNNNDNNDNNNNANMNAIMVTVTNNNMNMVVGRKTPFVNLWWELTCFIGPSLASLCIFPLIIFYQFRSLMEEKFLESLQRILISARSGDKCGLLIWCWFGWTMEPSSSSSTDLLTRLRQHLIYLALAELSGSSGKAFVDLVKMHKDDTCDAVRQNVSLMLCFWKWIVSNVWCLWKFRF